MLRRERFAEETPEAAQSVEAGERSGPFCSAEAVMAHLDVVTETD